MNNKVQLKSLTSYLSKTFSACKTLDDLWTACISTTKQVNFEHFSFRIQYPTPFTNPKNHTYGNYPFNPAPLLSTKRANITSGFFRICTEHLDTLSHLEAHNTAPLFNLDDNIYYITQSIPKQDGVFEHLLLARAHQKIEHREMKILHFVIEQMTAEIHNWMSKINSPTSLAVTLSTREKEILRWGADGKTSEEIAIILGLSQDAINFHYKTIQNKIGTTNRAQAITYAIIKDYI